MKTTLPKKKLKLQIIKKENKAFDCFATIKKDAYCMPSKFYANTHRVLSQNQTGNSNFSHHD